MSALTDEEKQLIESHDSHDEPDFEPRGGGNGDD